MLEEIKRLVKILNEEIDLVIVEGKRDKRALEKIGVKVMICTLFSLKEELIPEGSRVLILTDFDREGKKLHARLMRELKGRKINEWLRKEFSRVLGLYGRRTIESINNLLK